MAEINFHLSKLFKYLKAVLWEWVVTGVISLISTVWAFCYVYLASRYPYILFITWGNNSRSVSFHSNPSAFGNSQLSVKCIFEPSICFTQKVGVLGSSIPTEASKNGCRGVVKRSAGQSVRAEGHVFLLILYPISENKKIAHFVQSAVFWLYIWYKETRFSSWKVGLQRVATFSILHVLDVLSKKSKISCCLQTI